MFNKKDIYIYYIIYIIYIIYLIYIYINCYLAAPRPTLDHYRGDSLTHPMLITLRFPFSTRGSLGASQRGWVPKPGRTDSCYNALTHYDTLPINPLDHSPHHIYKEICIKKYKEITIFFNSRKNKHFNKNISATAFIISSQHFMLSYTYISTNIHTHIHMYTHTHTYKNKQKYTPTYNHT